MLRFYSYLRCNPIELSNRTNVHRVLPHEYTCRYPYSGTLLGRVTTLGLATPTTKTYCSFCDCQIFCIGITKDWLNLQYFGRDILLAMGSVRSRSPVVRLAHCYARGCGTEHRPWQLL